jgi:hypothetical protein
MADEVLINSFRIEVGDSATGVFTPDLGGISVTDRSVVFRAPASSKFYKVSAVKNAGPVIVTSVGAVQVIVDNNPPAPSNLSVE